MAATYGLFNLKYFFVVYRGRFVNISDQKYFLANKKGLHFCKPLIYMVGLHGLEPWTKGL